VQRSLPAGIGAGKGIERAATDAVGRGRGDSQVCITVPLRCSAFLIVPVISAGDAAGIHSYDDELRNLLSEATYIRISLL